MTIDETKTKLSSATQELSQERKRASNMSVVQFRLFKGPVHVIYTGRRMLKLVLNVKYLLLLSILTVAEFYNLGHIQSIMRVPSPCLAWNRKASKMLI